MNAPGIPVHVQKKHLFYYQSIILGKMWVNSCFFHKYPVLYGTSHSNWPYATENFMKFTQFSFLREKNMEDNFTCHASRTWELYSLCPLLASLNILILGLQILNFSTNIRDYVNLSKGNLTTQLIKTPVAHLATDTKCK